MAGEEAMTEEMDGEEEMADMIAATGVTMETEVTTVVTEAIMADLEEAAVINSYSQ